MMNSSPPTWSGQKLSKKDAREAGSYTKGWTMCMKETVSSPGEFQGGLKVLGPREVKIVRAETGVLELSLGEGTPVRVHAVRLFPLTDPEHHISIQDQEEKEIAIAFGIYTWTVVTERGERVFHVKGRTQGMQFLGPAGS